MRKEIFVEQEYYHIYCRGVDGRPIFMSDRERIHFINSIYILNNFLEIPSRFDLFTLEPRKFLTPIKPYVEFVAACLIPNHYHFMLTPKQEGGVSKFFQKLNLSHTNYFNRLHERRGRLFESTFNAKHVAKHEYASYLTQYIHLLNPYKLYRTKSGTKEEDLLKSIKEYKWSSLPIYLDRGGLFSLFISSDFRSNVLGMDSGEYEKVIDDLYKDLCTGLSPVQGE